MGDGYFLLTNLLSEDEKKVITSITAHIERGEKRVGIQQIASENFLSPTSIVKMCKRLGLDGYSELYYYLSRQFDSHGETRDSEPLKNLIDNYSESLITEFCELMDRSRTAKLFDRFVEELKLADVAVLAEIYAAREQNTMGISSADLARNIPGSVYCSTLDKGTAQLRELAKPGDLILTVGAGDIFRAGEKLLERA